jgi:Flp pilus assembly protein TadD
MSNTTPVKSTRIVRLALTTALASVTLTGCTGLLSPKGSVASAPNSAAAVSAQNLQAANQKVAAAESNILSAPRDLAARSQLASAYLEAGRFNSAASTFAEVLTLGDTSDRTIISYALSQLASGQSSAALATLDRYEAKLSPADFGLAVAMAGRPQQGVHVLSNALRSGDNTAKVRQNLAYAYALKGDWRSARLMVGQDLAANKIGDRLGEWAQTIAPGQDQARVAGLLSVPIVRDAGQPSALALRNFPEGVMLAQATPAASPAADPKAPSSVPNSFAAAFTESGELPPVAAAAKALGVSPAQVASVEPVALPAAKPVAKPASKPAPRPATVPTRIAKVDPTPAAKPASKPVAPKPVVKPAAKPVATPTTPPKLASTRRVTRDGVTYSSREMVQQVAAHTPSAQTPSTKPSVASRSSVKPSSKPVAKPAPARVASRDGGYRVQLGSYFSMSDAQAAWKVFMRRHPELNDGQKVITKAKVKGKIYYRVAAGGYARTAARNLCGRVKRGGAGCIAYAANSPLPGTIDNNVRVAQR